MNDSRPVIAPARLVWHAVALSLLLLVPVLKFGVPFWQLDRHEQIPWALLCAGYVLSAFVAHLRWMRGAPSQPAVIAVSTLGIFGLVFLFLLLADMQSSRMVELGIFLLALLLIPAAYAQRPLRAAAALLAAVVITGAILTVATLRETHETPRPEVSETLVDSGYYNVRAITYSSLIEAPAVRGGGLARIGDRYLLITGDGRLYAFGWEEGSDALDIRPLPYRVPVNGEEFAAAAGVPYENLPDEGGSEVQARWFRVGGVLVQQFDMRVRIFAAHHYWKDSEGCFVVRVSTLELTQQAWLDAAPGAAWQTLFETQPCLPIEGENRRRGTPFAGLFQGGRMIFVDPRTLLLTVGDHGFDGVNARQNLPQDPAASYGKTLLIDVENGRTELYTTGHRNPQGLFQDADGAIWLTEQGPRGGDELNLLTRGKNYGWPFTTLGTDYSSLVWPLHAPDGVQSEFEPPVYAWQPAIAVSNLIRIEGERFPAWQHDLLISSLAGRSLWRMHLRDHHPVLVEPIVIGSRIRDLIEGKDGRIVLWTDEATLISLMPAADTSGELLFDTRCGGCHRAASDEAHSIGPDLYDVVGRDIAAAYGYQDYSPALKALRGIWTVERLDSFLQNPRELSPGTSMEFPGMENADERRSIIEYLRSLE